MSKEIVSEEQPEVRVAPPTSPVVDDIDRYMTHAERQLSREQAMQERQARQDDENIISDFIVAAKTGAYMEARIDSVEIDDNEKNVYWICYCGPIVVRIPFEETFDVLPSELLDKSIQRLVVRRRQFLSKTIGVTIPFVVTEFSADPDGNYIAVGSRVEALKLIRRRYYGPRATKPIKVGDIVTARIINVGPSYLWVNIWGADVPVSNRNMSFRYISDMTDRYYPNDMVKVKVMSLKTKEDGTVEMNVSGRPVELEEAQKRLHLVKKGNRYAAVVTSIRTEPTMHVELWLEGINVPAYAATKDVRSDMNQKQGVYSGSFVYVEAMGVTKSGMAHVKLLPGKGRAGRR